MKPVATQACPARSLMNYCLITIQELVLIGEGKDKHFLIFNLRAGRRVECRLTHQHGRRWQGKAAANVPSAPPARLAFNPPQIRAAAGGISASAEHRSPRSGRGAQRLC